jgi:hypothetical protein
MAMPKPVCPDTTILFGMGLVSTHWRGAEQKSGKRGRMDRIFSADVYRWNESRTKESPNHRLAPVSAFVPVLDQTAGHSSLA